MLHSLLTASNMGRCESTETSALQESTRRATRCHTTSQQPVWSIFEESWTILSFLMAAKLSPVIIELMEQPHLRILKASSRCLHRVRLALSVARSEGLCKRPNAALCSSSDTHVQNSFIAGLKNYYNCSKIHSEWVEIVLAQVP